MDERTTSPAAPRASVAGVRSGFTIVELVVTIVVVSLIAAIVFPRFVGKDSFSSRGFFDQAQAVVRYAQKLAIAQRRTVYVCVNAPAAGDISASSASGCATQLSDPSGQPLKASAPSGVALTITQGSSPTNFNGLGQPNAALTITLVSSIAGDPARQIVVEAETGYVHP